jgi:hypothetical protein
MTYVEAWFQSLTGSLRYLDQQRERSAFESIFRFQVDMTLGVRDEHENGLE